MFKTLQLSLLSSIHSPRPTCQTSFKLHSKSSSKLMSSLLNVLTISPRCSWHQDPFLLPQNIEDHPDTSSDINVNSYYPPPLKSDPQLVLCIYKLSTRYQPYLFSEILEPIVST